MKKLMLLAALCALATIPASATWTWVTEGTKATDGSWTLTLAEDKIDGVTGLKITGKTMGSNTDLDLSTFEADTGRKIIRINNLFQWGKTAITSFVAPTLLRVEPNSFQQTSSLTNLQIGAAVWIGDNAFQYCRNVVSICGFSTDVKYLGYAAFDGVPFPAVNSPFWPCLKTLGDGALSGMTITGDVNVPSLTQLGSGLNKASVKSIYAPSLTNFTGAAFQQSTGITNLTIKGSATALAKAGNSYWYGGNSLKTYNWLGTEVPTAMPSGSLGGGCAGLFRLYVNAQTTAAVQGWAGWCPVTAKQIAEDETYAKYKKVSGYDAVKDRLIGFLGSADANGKASAYKGNGPCWIVNLQDVEEEVIYQSEIIPPDHSSIVEVTADGYVKEPVAGKYALPSSAAVTITYRADAGYQFEGKLSVYTQTDVTPAETIGPEVCEKSISAVTYRTLTLKATELAAAHIASVALTMGEPYLCTTNGDSIIYSVYDGVAFTLVYTAAKKYRFAADAAQTSSAQYPDGITVNTVVAAWDLPETSVCTWKYSDGYISDGNWKFRVSTNTVDRVEGLKLVEYVSGDGDLDFTNFKEESASEYDVISTPDYGDGIPAATGRIVAPGLRRVNQQFAVGKSVTELIAPNLTHIGYSAFYRCKQLTNVVFSSDIEDIGQQAFGDCLKLKSLANTSWPQLTYLGGSAFVNSCVTGDFDMPLLTAIYDKAFENTHVTSICAPKCEKLCFEALASCTALTNVVIMGSKGCFPANYEAMTGVGKVEALRYLGENAPTNLPSHSIYTAKTDEPMILYVNLKGETSRADWEKFCTATASDIATNATYAVITNIPNYNAVRRALVGFIGDVVTTKGAYSSVRATQQSTATVESGNGPCWVVDGNWRAPGMMLIIQ